MIHFTIVSKYTLIAILLGVFSGLIVTGIYVWSRQVNKKPLTERPVVAQPQGKLLSWDDPAGFTFQYAEGLTVNKHDEDKDNYAHLEITNASQPGKLIVWANAILMSGEAWAENHI